MFRDLETKQPVHAEISHFLCKAGLIENLPLVGGKAKVELIALKREPFKIAWSFANRFNFLNYGFTWLIRCTQLLGDSLFRDFFLSRDAGGKEIDSQFF